jgi:hypothetical protein
VQTASKVPFLVECHGFISDLIAQVFATRAHPRVNPVYYPDRVADRAPGKIETYDIRSMGEYELGLSDGHATG